MADTKLAKLLKIQPMQWIYYLEFKGYDHYTLKNYYLTKVRKASSSIKKKKNRFVFRCQ